jgi:hypothetical protein
MAAQLGRDAATAAGFRGKPAREAKILKVQPYKNTSGSMLGFLDVQLPSVMIVGGCKLMRGPRGALWVGLPNQKRRDRDDQVVLGQDGKPIWDPIIDFRRREDRDRFGNPSLPRCGGFIPELWETDQ